MIPGPYYKYPLRVGSPFGGAMADKDAPLDPGDLQYYALIFEPATARTVVYWRCISCAEAGREWCGELGQIQDHCQAHQMGFDFALYYLKKVGRLK